jgi:ribosomal protein S27AE
VQRVHIEYLGDSVELPLGETVVGRDIHCALRFNDAAVSRRHLRFIRRSNEVFVEDLGSSNGTLLNGRSVAAPLRIVDGDEIKVGGRTLTVHIAEGTDEDSDHDEPTTLSLRSMNPGSELMMGRPTQATLEVAVPKVLSAHQRCPRCAAAVSAEDDECATCGYHWGSFRPMTHTDLRPNPVYRRRHERTDIELHLVYTSGDLEIEAVSRDLSESGVFVCSTVLDPIGTECELTILVDGGPPLGVQGIVRRVVERPHAGDPSIGLGVEFVGLGETQLQWIRATLARLHADAS